MEADNMKKRKKWLIWGSVSVLILVLAVSLGFLIHDRIYSATLNIMVAPYMASVKVGDMKFSASEEVKMMPGEYSIEVSAPGFATKTGKLVLKADESSSLNLYLDSNSDTTVHWYEENAGDALIVGEIQSQESQRMINALFEKDPALKELPLTVEYYSNDYSKYTKYILSYELDNSERGFVIIMKDYTGEGTDAAFNKLREMGMDLTDLKISYEDMTGSALNFRAE